MIPAHVDVAAIIRDLNSWGYGNAKIEVVCGFASGHVSHFVAGRRDIVHYQLIARLYNFWLDECRRHEVLVPWGTPAPHADPSQHAAATT